MSSLGFCQAQLQLVISIEIELSLALIFISLPTHPETTVVFGQNFIMLGPQYKVYLVDKYSKWVYPLYINKGMSKHTMCVPLHILEGSVGSNVNSNV